MIRYVERKSVKGAIADRLDLFLTIGLLTSILGCASLDSMKGTISGEIYTAPDNSFVVELPFPKEAQSDEERRRRIRDSRDSDGTFNVTFGPAAFNRTSYRIMVARRDLIVKALGMRELADDEMRKVTLLAARRLVEELYQSKTAVISESTFMHDGQTVQYTGLVQHGLKKYPELFLERTVPQEMSVYHGIYIYVQKDRIVRLWIEDDSLFRRAETYESQFKERTYPRMQEVFDSFHLLPRQ